MDFNLQKQLNMKYIFIVFFALLFSKADAQNLQFSQVLTFALNQVVSDQEVGLVPDGKVWKVEFASVSTNGFIYVNNALIASSIESENHFPIWLIQGDLMKVNGTSTAGGPSYFISIIEFTVVP